jgi:U3 small nucleolar RNA-associated protein 18
VVSVYDLSRSEGSSGSDGNRSEVSNPLKMKSIMNLTMKINAMALHPAGELLAIGSDQRKDQLKMIHLPSCSVFSNWPTDRTPMGRVKCLEFSPGNLFFLFIT